MKLDSKSTLGILLITISILTLIPFIGLTDFHTKGEPREAIVAVSMLDSGNWILPEIIAEIWLTNHPCSIGQLP